MEFLQESVLGDKTAISANILSFTQGIPLSEAEGLLSEFFSRNQDALDASYKVITKDGVRSSIKILGSEAAQAEGAQSRIYIVSPQRASDPAVIAEVARRAKQLQLAMPVEKLSRAGVCVNPLLDREFIARSQKGPAISAVVPKPPVKVEDADPAGRREALPSGPQDAKPSASLQQPLKQSAPPKPASGFTTKKAESAQQSSSSSKGLPSKSGSFPFKKTDKNEALMSGRRRQTLPVPERVVVSEAAEDERDEPTDIRANKEAEQLKNLAKLYDQESPESEKMEAESMDVDDEDEADSIGEDDLNNPLEAENLFTQPIDLPEDNEISSQPAEGETASETAIKRKSIEPGNADNSLNPSDGSSKPRTKRVLKTIITQDDEGFDVRKQVYVEEPIDDMATESNSTHQPSGSKSSEQQSEMPHTEEKPKLIKRSKSPPTINKKNQTSLMSFFTSKH